MQTWAQLPLPVPCISLFGSVIAAIGKKKVWYDEFGLLQKQSDGPVTTLTVIINHSRLEGKNK